MTGGVGSFAAQLAVKAGATAVAPALPEDEEYQRGFGVSEVLPHEGDAVATVRERYPDGVDALLDLVNYAPGTYDGALKNGARLASSTGAAGEGPGPYRRHCPADERQPRARRETHRCGRLERARPGHVRARPPPEALQAVGTIHTGGKLAIRLV